MAEGTTCETEQNVVGRQTGRGQSLFEAERLALRFDIRDHVTTVGLGDLGLDDLGPIFGLSSSEVRVHNVELSFGIGIRF